MVPWYLWKSIIYYYLKCRENKFMRTCLLHEFLYITFTHHYLNACSTRYHFSILSTLFKLYSSAGKIFTSRLISRRARARALGVTYLSLLKSWINKLALPTMLVESFRVNRSNLLKVCALTDPVLPSLVIFSQMLGHEANRKRCRHGSVTGWHGLTQ